MNEQIIREVKLHGRKIVVECGNSVFVNGDKLFHLYLLVNNHLYFHISNWKSREEAMRAYKQGVLTVWYNRLLRELGSIEYV